MLENPCFTVIVAGSRWKMRLGAVRVLGRISLRFVFLNETKGKDNAENLTKYTV